MLVCHVVLVVDTRAAMAHNGVASPMQLLTCTRCRRYHAWNKLLAWTLTEYEKLVLIDSDAVLWNNADELFLFPEFAAVQDSVWPLMSQDYTQYFNTGAVVDVCVGVCMAINVEAAQQQCSDKNRRTRVCLLTPNVFCSHPMLSHAFTAGVMVIKPSIDTFNSLMKRLNGWARPTSFWWDLSEQTYLNEYFNTSWYHLPLSYNYVSFLFAGALDAEWNVEGIKIVHHLRDSQFDLPFSTPDCIKHYCPRCGGRVTPCDKDTAHQLRTGAARSSWCASRRCWKRWASCSSAHSASTPMSTRTRRMHDTSTSRWSGWGSSEAAGFVLFVAMMPYNYKLVIVTAQVYQSPCCAH